MLIHLCFLFTILIKLNKINSSSCNLITPVSKTDCFHNNNKNNSSNTSNECCYIYINNQNDSKFKDSCMEISNTTSTVLINTYQYQVDCEENSKNSKNEKVFDLNTCGNDSPYDLSACSLYSLNDKKCCWVYFGGQTFCFFIENNFSYLIDSGLTLFCFGFQIFFNYFHFFLLCLFDF